MMIDPVRVVRTWCWRVSAHPCKIGSTGLDRASQALYFQSVGTRQDAVFDGRLTLEDLTARQLRWMVRCNDDRAHGNTESVSCICGAKRVQQLLDNAIANATEG